MHVQALVRMEAQQLIVELKSTFMPILVLGPVLIQNQLLIPNPGVHPNPTNDNTHRHTLFPHHRAHSVNTVNKLAPIDRGGYYNKTIPGFIEVQAASLLA